MGSAVLTNAVATQVDGNQPTKNLNTTLHLGMRTGGVGTSYALIYFSRPFPLGANIISARIVWYMTALPENVTHTVTWQRLNQSFSASKVTYDTRPTSLIAGTKPQSKVGVYAAGSEWEVDVADWMQSISNGGVNYGFRVSYNQSLKHSIYSELYTNIALRPRLEVTWSDAPQTPTGLSPSGARAVGEPKPVVRANFLDVSGSTALQAVNVQINATDVWTAPSFDSGTVLTSVPELDLESTAFAGVADGSTVFWRIRFQDAAGIWSAWSASTSFKYDARGTLTLNNPPALPQPNGAFWRGTWTASQTAGSAGLYYRGGSGQDPGGTASPGDILYGTAWVRSSRAQTMQLGVEFKDAAEVTLGSTHFGTSTAIPANTWTKLTVTTGAAPANTTRFVVVAYETGSTNFLSGDTLDLTALTVGRGSGTTNILTNSYAATNNYVNTNAGTSGTMSLSNQTTGGPTVYPVLEDTTPPISWGFSGETQAAYQIQIKHTVNGVDVVDWDTGKLTSTATSVTVPSGKINEPSNTVYTLTMRVWDNKQREATAGFPVYSEVVRQFAFVPGATTGTTALTAVPNASGVPKVVLTWTAATFPDRFNILRGGKVIASSLDPDDTFVSGTTHTWTDKTPHPNRPLTYEVQRVVNNVASSTNTTASNVIVKSKGIWLQEPISGIELFISGKEDRAFTLNEQGTVLQAIAPNSVPMAINQSLGGLEGVITGTLVNYGALTAQQWRDRYIQLRNMRVKQFLLTTGDYAMKVVCQEFTYQQRTVPTPAFVVSFKFYQQDHLTNPITG